MTQKAPPIEHAADGRREVDVAWRARIEQTLKDMDGHLATIDKGLAINTADTKATRSELAEHVERTERFVKKMAPAVTAVDSYTQGVRVIGAVGVAFQWCAKWLARFLKFVAPVAAAFAAVYATWPEASKAFVESAKFWNWFKH